MSKKRSTTRLKPIRIKKILVPIDFSECSSNALRQAIFLAQAFAAKIELINVTTPIYVTGATSQSLIPYDNINYKKLMKITESKMLKIAKDIKAKEAIDVKVKTALDVVYVGILDYAKKIDADLIIMGTHGTSGIKEFFAGSNAYRVVSEAECPVLTVQKQIIGKKFKNIVVPIRLEMNSRQKIVIAATLAKMFSSKIILTGFVSAPNKRDELKVRQYMSQVEILLDKEAISYKSTFIKNKNFTKSIIDHAKKNKADLIAVMTKHDFSLSQILNGPFAEQFVNHSKIPLLSVPDRISFDYDYTPSLSGGYQNN